MTEQLKYVSPEYQAQLDALAEKLCTPERFGRVAVGQMVLFDQEFNGELEENIIVGEE